MQNGPDTLQPSLPGWPTSSIWPDLTREASRPPRRRTPAWAVPARRTAIIVAMAATLLWLARPDTTGQPADQDRNALSAGEQLLDSDLEAPAAGPGTPDATRLEALQRQLDTAQARLDAYRLDTRYPPESRPLRAPAALPAAEPGPALEPALAPASLKSPRQPAGLAPGPAGRDGASPFAAGSRLQPLRTTEGEPLPNRLLATAQERVELSGRDTTVLQVAVLDDARRPLPLRVAQATARELPAAGSSFRAGSASVSFTDDGRDGDAIAHDGVWSARVLPAAWPTGPHEAIWRIEAELQTDLGRSAQAIFELAYAPQPPAVWGGPVRETLQQGSLVFELPLEVAEPGRYQVSARAVDAQGRPLAVLLFDGPLEAGAQTVPLTLFGRLLRDAQTVFPVTLRDVEGHVLRETEGPAAREGSAAMRTALPYRAGLVHASATYPASAFSQAEWNGEPRRRRLAELTREVEQARRELAVATTSQASR